MLSSTIRAPYLNHKSKMLLEQKELRGSVQTPKVGESHLLDLRKNEKENYKRPPINEKPAKECLFLNGPYEMDNAFQPQITKKSKEMVRSKPV